MLMLFMDSMEDAIKYTRHLIMKSLLVTWWVNYSYTMSWVIIILIISLGVSFIIAYDMYHHGMMMRIIILIIKLC